MILAAEKFRITEKFMIASATSFISISCFFIGYHSLNNVKMNNVNIIPKIAPTITSEIL